MTTAMPMPILSRRERIIESVIAKRIPIASPPEHRPRTAVVPVEIILQCVAHNAGLTVDEMLAKSRDARLVQPRQIGMYLAWVLCDLSLPKIAKAFRLADHTTVMYARDRVQARIATDEKFAERVERLRTAIELVQLDLRLAGVRQVEAERIMARAPRVAAGAFA